MAHAKTRRTRRPAADGASPLTRASRLIRPEIAGAALIVLAAALIPYLLPLAGALRAARDGLVGALGLHAFTLAVLALGLGALLALRRGAWLRRRARHLAGAALLLAFSAGLLGLWRPDAIVGSIDLRAASAGGDAGRLLTSGPIAVLAWLAALPPAFALLWPRTAARLLRASPRASARAAAWLWRHGPRPVLAAALVRLRRFGASGLPEAPPDPFAELRAPPPPAPAPAPPPPAAPAAGAPPPAGAAGPQADREPGGAQMEMYLDPAASSTRHSSDGWQLPPIELLAEAEPLPPAAADQERRARLIVETLASFGVEANVSQISEGPTVTQFGIEPGWDVRTRAVPERTAAGEPVLDEHGQPRTRTVEVSRTRVRVNRITALQNDLALALAAPALRIEAPVPGKSVVGIEVPNERTAVVTLRGVLASDRFARTAAKARLPIALGSGVSGAPEVADLAGMPHLLIAGATGAGKSVCLNSIIASLLMNYSPEQLRLVMIDPKRVELAPFADIPHLAFSEIVIDMDKVVGTLQAVIHEMESRYRRFAQIGVRNLERYNESGDGQLPYWVVIIDELADLMLAAPYQVEHQLVRLAQLARATGIHLVVATQRPSVDVVTGLIKANFPTRIAFAVSSQVDSRTILDSGGAEKLLGKGDMLFQPKDKQKPTRLQGVYVSDEEIEDLVAFWTHDRFLDMRPPAHDDMLEAAGEAAAALQPGGGGANGAGGGGEGANGPDAMLAKAIELARGHEQVSTSLLQRRLRIGYPRAARLMDDLEEQGVVGPPEGGSGSRPVLPADAGGEAPDAAPVAGLAGGE